jgi:O-succinylbenzoic acid--CoA ligase
MTETASLVAAECGPAAGRLAGRVGEPLPGMAVRAGRPDAPARVRLRGPLLMRGYATPQRRPGIGLEHDWYTTQDLGWLDEAGALHIEGRADEVLFSGGVKIHPAHLEARLGACPQIGHVGVTGLADRRWGDRLVAVYTGEAARTAVEQWCRAHIAAAERPRLFLRVTELPLLGPGKLDRRRLRACAEQALQPDEQASD